MKSLKLLPIFSVLFYISGLYGQDNVISITKKEPLLSKNWVTYYPKKDSINSIYIDHDLVLIPRANSKANMHESTLADWKPKAFNNSGRFTNWDVLYCGRMKSVPITGKWRGIYNDFSGLKMLTVFIENTGGNYSNQFKNGQIIRYEIQHINDSLIVGNKLDYGTISSYSIYEHEVDVLPKIELEEKTIKQIVKNGKLKGSHKKYTSAFISNSSVLWKSSAYPKPNGHKSNEFIDISVSILKNGTIKVNTTYPRKSINEQKNISEIFKNIKVTPATRDNKNVDIIGRIRIMKKALQKTLN